MDTPAWFADTRVCVRLRERESDLTVLSFTIAGLVALCGVNDAGVSVWCNTLEDRSVPVAKTGRDWQTLWAVVIEHAAPPKVAAAAGSPDLRSWVDVAFGARSRAIYG